MEFCVNCFAGTRVNPQKGQTVYAVYVIYIQIVPAAVEPLLISWIWEMVIPVLLKLVHYTSTKSFLTKYTRSLCLARIEIDKLL